MSVFGDGGREGGGGVRVDLELVLADRGLHSFHWCWARQEMPVTEVLCLAVRVQPSLNGAPILRNYSAPVRVKRSISRKLCVYKCGGGGRGERERERERERECVCERERERVCVRERER